MSDVAFTTRDDVANYVFKHLIDRRLCDNMHVTAADGSHPMIFALRDDSMTDTLAHVAAMGGAANVVVPWLNGLIFTEMHITGSRIEAPPPDNAVGASCTVGLLLARLMEVDGGDASYAFAVSTGENATVAGRALESV